MSLPRQDVRFYLDTEIHRRLKRLCSIDRVELAEFVERHIVAIVDREFSRAISLLEDEPEQHGIVRSGAEPGVPPRSTANLPYARQR